MNEPERAKSQADIVVVGAGLVGMAAALGIAKLTKGTCCISVLGPAFAPDPKRPDTRTTAVFNPGLQLLRNLDVYQQLEHAPAPLEAIRIVDDMRGLFQAPEMLFHAKEVGVPMFGANIVNADLSAALHAAIDATPGVRYHPTTGVTAINQSGTSTMVQTSEGQEFPADLIIGADGRASISRDHAQIGVTSWDYDQTAIVCSFDHTSPHQNVSTEFHRPGGPFTLVPVAEHRSSLVWVERPAVAERLHAMSDNAFLETAQERSHGLLGTLSNVGPRGMFPLKGQTAKKFGAGNIVLLGEAAHVMPPIGAQGLNLGYRDVGALLDCIEEERSAHTVLKELVPQIVRAYARNRSADVQIRTLGVDLLSKSLTLQMLPVQLGRTLGLHALRLFGPLRRTLMKQGMAPSIGLPRSMQPGFLEHVSPSASGAG